MGTDNVLGGRRATQHLMKLGRKRIVFLGGSDPKPRSVTAATAKHCRKPAVRIDDALIGRVEFEAESAEAAVDGLLMRKIPFDGIVAASDLIALGGIRALHRKRESTCHAISRWSATTTTCSAD